MSASIYEAPSLPNNAWAKYLLYQQSIHPFCQTYRVFDNAQIVSLPVMSIFASHAYLCQSCQICLCQSRPDCVFASHAILCQSCPSLPVMTRLCLCQSCHSLPVMPIFASHAHLCQSCQTASLPVMPMFASHVQIVSLPVMPTSASYTQSGAHCVCLQPCRPAKH